MPAKVPILKFFDGHGNREVDISCNTAHGALNTHLLFCYGQVTSRDCILFSEREQERDFFQLDWRVCPLVFAVKAWAKAQGINEAFNGTLSSYSITLLVLVYLQVMNDDIT